MLLPHPLLTAPLLLLLLLMTSSLPLITSLPDLLLDTSSLLPSPSSHSPLQLADSAEDQQRLQDRYIAFLLHHHRVGTTADNVLVNSDDARRYAENPAPEELMGDERMHAENLVAEDERRYAENPAAEELTDDERRHAENPAERFTDPDAVRLTEDMRQLLERIHQGVLQVEQRRQAWQRLQHLLVEAGKKNNAPTNHFLRIGRSGEKNIAGGSSGKPELDTPLDPYSSSLLSSPFRDASAERSGQGRARLAGRKFHLGDGGWDEGEYREDPVHHSHYLTSGALSAFSRVGRSFSHRNHFLRIGRTAGYKTPSSTSARGGSKSTPRVLLATPGFQQQRWKEGESFGTRSGVGVKMNNKRSSEDSVSAYNLSPVVPVVRRSYVRIGRLPHTVFLQRMRQNQPDSGLASRRSNGYRLTKSGIMRAGKRAI